MTNNHGEYAPLGTYTSERSESRTATEQSSLIEASKGELEDRDETQSEQIQESCKERCVRSKCLSKPNSGKLN